MDRAQWLVKEALQKVRNSALHRLFHEEHHAEGIQARGTVSQQHRITLKSLDELERGVREPGRQTFKLSGVRDAATQTENRTTNPGQRTECTSIRNGATQTQDRGVSVVETYASHKDLPPIQVALNSDTPAALYSLAEQNLGKVVAVMDKSMDIPVLLLQPGLMNIMKEIRSSKQVVNALEAKSRKAAEVLQKHAEDLNSSLKDLQDSTSNEQIDHKEHERAVVEDVNNNPWDEILTIDQALKSERQNLEMTRYAFVDIIERALSDGELLEPMPDQDEAWKAKEHLYHHSNPVTPVTETFSSGVVSADELFRRAALEDLAKAHQRYMDHLDQFESRGDMYENDFRDYRQAVEDGTCSLTMTDFDRTYVENISNLTHWLRKTEAAYEEALETARRLKLLTNEYEQESNFVSDVSDGYRESFEASICAGVDRRIVERWNEEVLTTMPLEDNSLDTHSLFIEQSDMTEVDQWDAKSVGLSSSLSMKDGTRNRRRIDRWRQQCGL
ncbi:hypothetical protein MMC17_002622 [Xylographa soralifera]|nr:hypothetical protein [Xylographa soralifera]